MAKEFTTQLGKGKWVTVTPGKSITLTKVAPVHSGVPSFEERTFRIGDAAEYDSYNLSYFGPIKSITKKNVIITHKHSDRTTRLPFAIFHMRNIKFDAHTATKRNSETMMSI